MKTAAETVTLVREALSVADAASQQATRGASEWVQHALHGDEGTSAGRSVTGDSNPEACPAWKRPVAIEATLCAQPHPFLSNMLASGDALLVPLRQRIGAGEFGRGYHISGCANRTGVCGCGAGYRSHAIARAAHRHPVAYERPQGLLPARALLANFVPRLAAS